MILFLSLIVGILETFSIAILYPLLNLAFNEKSSFIFNYLISDPEDLTQSLFYNFIFLAMFIFLFSILMKGLFNWILLQYIHNCEANLSKRLLRIFLSNPYEWFIRQNSSELLKTVNSEVESLIMSFLLPMLRILTDIIITSFIILMLLFIQTKITVIISFFIILPYFLFFIFIKHKFIQLGNERLNANKERFEIIKDIFLSIKEVKVLSLENNFMKLVSKEIDSYAITRSLHKILTEVPRYILEMIILFCSLLFLFYMKKFTELTLNQVIPIIAVYFFAAMRMIPYLQRIFNSISHLEFSSKPAQMIKKYLDDDKKIDERENQIYLKQNFKSLNLQSINYSYFNSNMPTLLDVNLSIEKGDFITIKGDSGSGKSTLISIILNLVIPNKGIYLFNNERQITEEYKISNLFSYVPQKIFISNNTIKENIIFYKNEKSINYELLDKVINISQLSDLINSRSDLSIIESKGDKMNQISGGQAQRIGIARALYQDKPIMILDEGTSSLDERNEKLIIDGVKEYFKDLTIINISHKNSFDNYSNKVFSLKNNKIKQIK